MGNPAPQRSDGRKAGGSSAAGFARGMNLAFEFAGAVALFWFFGRLVDNWLDIDPWGQVVGSVIGWVGGVLHVIYRADRT